MQFGHSLGCPAWFDLLRRRNPLTLGISPAESGRRTRPGGGLNGPSVKDARAVARQMRSYKEATSRPVSPYRNLTAARWPATAVDSARCRCPVQVPRSADQGRPRVYEQAATGPGRGGGPAGSPGNRLGSGTRSTIWTGPPPVASRRAAEHGRPPVYERGGDETGGGGGPSPRDGQEPDPCTRRGGRPPGRQHGDERVVAERRPRRRATGSSGQAMAIGPFDGGE
jgi:hypothetical protein